MPDFIFKNIDFYEKNNSSSTIDAVLRILSLGEAGIATGT